MKTLEERERELNAAQGDEQAEKAKRADRENKVITKLAADITEYGLRHPGYALRGTALINRNKLTIANARGVVLIVQVKSDGPDSFMYSYSSETTGKRSKRTLDQTLDAVLLWLKGVHQTTGL